MTTFKQPIPEDPNVLSVVEKFQARSRVGYLKYNTNTTRQDLSTLDWLEHLQDELMDATIYIERLKQEFTNAITKLSNLDS